MALIYCVEDDDGIRELISCALRSGGYEVKAFPKAKPFYEEIRNKEPSLGLLDIMLPDEDGYSILSKLKKDSHTQDVPVIMLTAKSSELDKVSGLEMGADDYITKPFGAGELLARIRTAIRHTRTGLANETIATTGKFKSGDLEIDYDKHQVLVEGKNVGLTQNEYKIVALLGKCAGKVLTYDYIIKELWGPGTRGNNQSLRVHMANIRRKIEKSPAEPQYIFTEIGVGYRMVEGD